MSLALIEEMYHSTYQLIDPYLIIQKVSIYNILNFFFYKSSQIWKSSRGVKCVITSGKGVMFSPVSVCL